MTILDFAMPVVIFMMASILFFVNVVVDSEQSLLGMSVGFILIVVSIAWVDILLAIKKGEKFTWL